MWKYNCKKQLFSLVIAFIIGVLIMVVANGNDNFLLALQEGMPSEYFAILQQQPWLIYLSGGIALSGVLNVFTLGNMMSSSFSGGPFIVLMIFIFFPSYAMLIGVFSLPICLIVYLYGWISLTLQTKNLLRKADINGDDEIVRIYKLHHQLDEQYASLAHEVKTTMFKIRLTLILAFIAAVVVLFFVGNIILLAIMLVFLFIVIQSLGRMRRSVFSPIANLLYVSCDPEACISALIYYGQKRNGHYRLSNRALMAQALIYLDDPSLAQDVLIGFPLSSPNNILAYWSVMGYSYYLLKDENGLIRARDAMEKVRPNMGAVGLMVKSAELNSIENKIHLMQGDFNTCKKYYLEQLKHSSSKMQSADCDYYIALISFVQEDLVLAKMYFEKTIQVGNKLYFVRNARNYLSKIEASENQQQTEDETQSIEYHQ